ncbi:MAG TPA: PfkB family carbohydrate kinase, partial [Anaerolineales bacterium]|nr:PfkB family carbohydrate kinase [Anaerolineales bacterium]
RKLKEWGVQGEVRFTDAYKTPLEVNVSDKTGARTYFWQRSGEILSTLDAADLSLIKDSKLLYVDWYDGDHILRAVEEANRWGVPVYLNLEHGHKFPDVLKKYASRVTICQAVTDAAQLGRMQATLAAARKLLKAGITTAIITMASQGCLAVQGDEIVRVHAPKVKAVDGSGAGATFSAGFIYGYLNGWTLEESVRFGIAAASLKVTRSGLTMFPVEDIKRMAEKLRVQRMVYRDDQFYTIKKLLSLPRNNPLFEEGRRLANLASQKLQFKKRFPSKGNIRQQSKKKTI